MCRNNRWNGEIGYHFLQDHVTHSAQVTQETIAERMRLALQYLDEIAGLIDISSTDIRYIDIGSGWMPTIPLVFYSTGVDRLMLLDVRQHMQIRKVADVICEFRSLALQEQVFRTVCHRLPREVKPTDTLESYLAQLGIHYVAPYSLEDLDQQQGCNLATCTSVLQYMREAEIRGLLKKLAATMRQGGIFLGTIALHADDYTRFDRSLSRYVKWQYSSFTWDRLISSRLMTLNQLTSPEYHQMLEESGFRLIKFETPEISGAELAELTRTPLHQDFTSKPLEDFAPSSLFFVAQRL